MKRFIYLAGIIVLSGFMIFISCKKENNDAPSVDNTPVLTFMTGTDYISSDTTLEVNSEFKVGILGSKNPNTNIDIATFTVVRTFNNVATTVYEENSVGESYLSWETVILTVPNIGEEKWTFTIKDYTGLIKELSFVITTQGDKSPVMTFIEGVNYVSQNVTLNSNSIFQVGINCIENPYTNNDISSFKVIRTFNNIATTVYEEYNIGSPDYTWEDDPSTNEAIGEEMWTFTVSDIEGEINELSFIITTNGSTPYIPSFSPTYLIVNQGGDEVLDFYITCTTDDWEMIKIIVTYPGGLGSEAYTGNGQIMTQYTPFTFSNYFPKLGGVWTFSILGIIKSGQHVNESFSVVISMVVTGTLPATNWTDVVCDAVGTGVSADNPNAIPDPSGWGWGNQLIADATGIPVINGDEYTWTWTGIILEADEGFKVRTLNGEAPPSGGANFDAGYSDLDAGASSTHVYDNGGNLSVDLKGAYTITLVIDAANNDVKKITIVEN